MKPSIARNFIKSINEMYKCNIWSYKEGSCSSEESIFIFVEKLPNGKSHEYDILVALGDDGETPLYEDCFVSKLGSSKRYPQALLQQLLYLGDSIRSMHLDPRYKSDILLVHDNDELSVISYPEGTHVHHNVDMWTICSDPRKEDIIVSDYRRSLGLKPTNSDDPICISFQDVAGGVNRIDDIVVLPNNIRDSHNLSYIEKTMEDNTFIYYETNSSAGQTISVYELKFYRGDQGTVFCNSTPCPEEDNPVIARLNTRFDFLDSPILTEEERQWLDNVGPAGTTPYEFFSGLVFSDGGASLHVKVGTEWIRTDRAIVQEYLESLPNVSQELKDQVSLYIHS